MSPLASEVAPTSTPEFSENEERLIDGKPESEIRARILAKLYKRLTEERAELTKPLDFNDHSD